MIDRCVETVKSMSIYNKNVPTTRQMIRYKHKVREYTAYSLPTNLPLA